MFYPELFNLAQTAA
jgi:hypothetical protein